MPRPATLRAAAKKKTLEADERDEEERLAFRRRMASVDRRKLVFTDETGFHLAFTRAFGRAPRGERVVGHVPFTRGANHSLLGSLGLRGMVASLLLKGSVDHSAFDAFVNELLLPQVRAGDVLLLDNLPAHKASAVEESAARAKAEVIWLPAYSPDFSPNENCWLKIKNLVRGQQPRTTQELNKAVSAAVQAVTKGDIAAWFKHCGY
ncbi:MAG: IS630 family transposase [Acidobacteria bacterium]|nr:IS630 family transposase [Acidobacteriota bacterium]